MGVTGVRKYPEDSILRIFGNLKNKRREYYGS
jgi:hypothetical protein